MSISSEKGSHRLAHKIADYISHYTKDEGIDKIKLQYGIEIVILSAAKLIVVFAIALILGIFVETLVVIISFNITRSSAYGVHATTSMGCLLSSLLIILPSTMLVKNIQMTNWQVLMGFIIMTVLLGIYAPADTEKRPIIGRQIRKQLKKRTIVISLILGMVTLLIPFGSIKSLMVLGATIEVITVLPITYRLLKQRRDNYEEHEREGSRAVSS